MKDRDERGYLFIAAIIAVALVGIISVICIETAAEAMEPGTAAGHCSERHVRGTKFYCYPETTIAPAVCNRRCMCEEGFTLAATGVDRFGVRYPAPFVVFYTCIANEVAEEAQQ